MQKKPLEGITVLDLTRVLNGPFGTMLLADMGANVIKLEMPGSGDDTRQFEPIVDGQSGYFIGVNRGKRSVSVNLKSEKGEEIFFKLLKQSDVVVQNYRPGVMERLGLDFETMRKVKPDIIYAASSGFGQTGVWSPLAAYDIIAQGMSGIMSMTGDADGPPTKTGPSIMDIFTGMFTCIGVLAALQHRDKTGEGQMIDVAMLDSGLAVLENAIPRYYMLNEVANRRTKGLGGGPFGAYPTKDGYAVIAAANPRLFFEFAKAIGQEDWLEDPRFESSDARRENAQLIYDTLVAWTTQRTTNEVFEIMSKVGVPAGPVFNIDEVLATQHVKERQSVIEIEDPILGSITVPNIPIKFSGTPSGPAGAAPLLGQHNEEILKGVLGYTDEDIEQFKKDGVI